VKKPTDFPDLEKAVKDMLKIASTFDEKKAAIDTALKFETLKLKAKGDEHGKGFDSLEGEDESF
jgi:hypothetical protein